jgi:hypothetical protein
VHRNEKPLFDHLVGEGVELRRDRKAERIGGVVVDYQMKPSGLLGRQVGWLCALEDFELASRGAPARSPMRQTLAACCARAAIGQAAATPLTSVMKSRRLMRLSPRARTIILPR